MAAMGKQRRGDDSTYAQDADSASGAGGTINDKGESASSIGRVFAILGAIGGRDIGTLFPDTDAAYKDADSLVLLQKVWEVATHAGWRLVNADITLLAEAPKVKPHVQTMRERLSTILQCSSDQIAIKATTMEKMGFIGREEGIVASAVVLLSR